ncbi:MAG: exodeoxyribonuclease VII large subunit [Bacillota bacterium]
MQQRVVSVTELTNYLKDKLQSDALLRDLSITGEISNFHHHSSGHMYFTLKDDTTRIKVVMFRSNNQQLKFQPESGMQVIIKGYVDIYRNRGEYQLYAQQMQPAGVGALQIAFEQLKEKLQAEGLFSSHYKQQLPEYPIRIGVITSPSGAAIKDILSVIKRRFAGVEILLAPATVQGKQSAPTLVRAIEQLNRVSDVDVIIISRGGGSLEDLWSFNEEEVARAIFNSSIPIISAVGHETDYTIADFVADKRAPTPSAAGELVVADKAELASYVGCLTTNLIQNINQKLSAKRNRVEYLTQRSVLLEPKRQLNEYQQRVDDLERRLINKLNQKLKLSRERFQSLTGKLDSLSPLNTLSRGYTVCRELESKRRLTSVSEIEIEDKLELILVDGKLTVQVKELNSTEIDSEN